jgi:hypothetical protein
MRTTGVLLLVAVGLAAGAVGWHWGDAGRDPGATTEASEIARLEAENAALRARLDAALERPPALTGRPPPQGAAPPPAEAATAADEPDDPAPPGVVTVTEALAVAQVTTAAPADLPDDVRDLLDVIRERVDLEDVLRDVVLDPAASATRREQALSMLVVADPEAAVHVVRSFLRSRDEAERAMARRAMVGARDPAFLPLLQEAMERPEEGESPVPYMNAIARLKGSAWSAVQMTGPPDTPIAGDLHTAWASASADMGEVTVEADFPVAVRPDAVRVHETYNPGAIARVAVRTSQGWVTVWEGRAHAGSAPRWFEPPLATVDDSIRTVLLVLDTNRVPGWNEIDAVELVGDGRRQWASAARASSTYGDQRKR